MLDTLAIEGENRRDRTDAMQLEGVLQTVVWMKQPDVVDPLIVLEALVMVDCQV